MNQIYSKKILLLSFFLTSILGLTYNLKGNEEKISISPLPTLNFSHQLHINEKISCKSCHAEDETNHRSLPTMDSCVNCHSHLENQKEKPLTNCTTCHANPDLNVQYTHDEFEETHWVNRIKTVFPPAAKEHEKFIDCTSCHTQITKSELASDNNYPNMTSCTSCHCNPNEIDP